MNMKSRVSVIGLSILAVSIMISFSLSNEVDAFSQPPNMNAAEYEMGVLQGQMSFIQGEERLTGFFNSMLWSPNHVYGYEYGFNQAKKEAQERNLAELRQEIHREWAAMMNALYASMGLAVGAQAGGDPLIFSLDERPACTKKMHPDQAESLQWYFELIDEDVRLPMERQLCEGTYLAFVDYNNNGRMDDGREMLWHTTYTAYHFLHNEDLFGEGNYYDGRLDINDASWSKIRIMDHEFNVYNPETLGIESFEYNNAELFKDDDYGLGIYADCLYDGVSDYKCMPVSTAHFRIVAWNEVGMTLEDQTIIPTYGAMQTPLNDCTVFDIRYMAAEFNLAGLETKQRTPETTEIAMTLYEQGLEFCRSFEFANANPDKYMSHWVAGKASALHTNDRLEESLPYYEMAIAMSPDRYFYLADYADALHRLGHPPEETLPIVEKAVRLAADIDPEYTYAKKIWWMISS